MQISHKQITDAVEYIVLSFDRFSSKANLQDLELSFERSRAHLQGLMFLFPVGGEYDYFSEAIKRLESIKNRRVISLNQPGGVGRLLAQPSGALGQVNTSTHEKNCKCDECSCMGFGFLIGTNEGSEQYPFVIGE